MKENYSVTFSKGECVLQIFVFHWNLL